MDNKVSCCFEVAQQRLQPTFLSTHKVIWSPNNCLIAGTIMDSGIRTARPFLELTSPPEQWCRWKHERGASVCECLLRPAPSHSPAACQDKKRPAKVKSKLGHQWIALFSVSSSSLFFSEQHNNAKHILTIHLWTILPQNTGIAFGLLEGFSYFFKKKLKLLFIYILKLDFKPE